MNHSDFYSLFDAEYIDIFFVDTIYKNGFECYCCDKIYFLSLVIKKTVKKYIETQNEKNIVFDSLLKLTNGSVLFDFFLRNLEVILHKIKCDATCKSCNDFNNLIKSWIKSKNYDNYLKFECVNKCPKYTNIINLMLNFVSSINTFSEKFTALTQNTISEIFSFVEKLNDLYIYYLFAANVNSIIKNRHNNSIRLSFVIINDLEKKIILMLQGFYAGYILLTKSKYEEKYLNFVISYLFNNNKKILIEILDDKRYYEPSFKHFFWNIIIKNNFFNLSKYEIINGIELDNKSDKIGLFNVILECYEYHLNNKNIELMHQINNFIEILIDDLDLNQTYTKKIITEFEFNILPIAINNKIIKKIIEYENPNEFIIPLKNYITTTLNIALLSYNYVNIHTNNYNQIENIDCVVDDIFNNCSLTTNRKKIIYRINTVTENNTSSGRGVTASNFQKIARDLFELISKNGVLDLDNNDPQHAKRVMLYGFICALSFANLIIIPIPNYIIKLMLNREILLSDVCDTQFINSLYGLKNLSETELSDISLTMSVPITVDNKISNFDLEMTDENSSEVTITHENLDRYITLMENYYTFKNIKAPRYKIINEFIKGFTQIYEGINLQSSPNMIFEILTCLNKYPPISKEKVIKLIRCDYYQTKDWIIKFLTQNNLKTTKKFINFVTGVDYLASNNHIEIKYSYSNKKSLPVALTCFNRLEIYNEYKNYEEFSEKLMYVLDNYIGFQYG